MTDTQSVDYWKMQYRVELRRCVELEADRSRLVQRVAKLESELATMSGIMREYSQGYYNVCQQLKAASVETVSALPDTAHEVSGFHVLDLSGQGVNHD